MNYYSRGFEIDAYQFDGVPIPRDGTWQFGDNNADMILYDHVEIVRGATGLMQGAGEPGASINFIRKRPTSFLRREVAAAVATPTGGRVEADISGPLNESGTVRGRLLGAADAREGTLDRYFKERYVGFGALEVDIDRHDAAQPRHQLPGDRRRQRQLGRPAALVQRRRADRLALGLQPRHRLDLRRHPAHRGLRLARARLRQRLDRARSSATHVDSDFQGQLGWFPPGRRRQPDLHRPGDRRAASSPLAAKYDGGYTQDSLNAVLNGDYQALGRIHDVRRRRLWLQGQRQTTTSYGVDLGGDRRSATSSTGTAAGPSPTGPTSAPAATPTRPPGRALRHDPVPRDRRARHHRRRPGELVGRQRQDD